MVTSVHKRGFDCQVYQVNMAATTSETNSSRYPSEKSVKEALDMLKPPGILSKAYNQFQLKRYQFKTIQSSSKQTESRVDETFLTVDLFQSQTELTNMGDYPGSGYKMSSYGLKTYNPQETVGQWTQCCKREEAIRKNHIVTSGGDGVANTWKVERPKSLALTQDTSYFLAKTLHEKPSTYDRINHVVEGYNQKLHRDDREHAKSRGLKVNSEETRVAVPSLSSSVVGHPQRNPLEFPDRQHVRVEICKKDFLRLGGTNIGDTD
ncbi:unnamed protein product [Porites evermanni]|uniref:Uncharacterized protein n=1 Tax=Porites evermanni TaxID=104178 RepID=A0ABN8QCN1_9CNID|nr:unnamed protein product [Porites evermanni]